MSKSIRADIWDLLNTDTNAIRRKSGLAIAYKPPWDGNWFTLTLSAKTTGLAPDGYQIAGVQNAVMQVCKNAEPFKVTKSVVQPQTKFKDNHIRRIRFYVRGEI